MNNAQQFAAAKELLSTTKRSLQIVDEQIARLTKQRVAVQLDKSVSTEHRVAWLGAVDDSDSANGILLGDTTGLGLASQHFGTIRNQEDAAFVCTHIFVCFAQATAADPTVPVLFSEDQNAFFNINQATAETNGVNPALRLTDGNTGRSLITGNSIAPADRDRGIVPFSYISSIRPGMGANVKNALFSEFTIPRAGVIRAQVFNLGSGITTTPMRAYVSLFGFKVYGAG